MSFVSPRFRSVLGSIFLAALAHSQPAYADVVKTTTSEAGRTVETWTFNIEGVSFLPADDAGKPYQIARLDGVSDYQAIDYKIGKPEVPLLRLYVDGDVSVHVDQSTVRAGQLPEATVLVPVQPSRIKAKVPRPQIVRDDNAYAQSAPPQMPFYSLEDAGMIRGQMRRLLTLRPMAYAPATGYYQLHTRFVVTVTKKATPKDKLPLASAIILGERYENSPAIDDYIAMKSALGFRVVTLKIQRTHTAEDIRRMLRAEYLKPDHQLVEALIIGDIDDVASKTADNITGVTDHYYRALDQDYAADINGPDIKLGRLAVQSTTQLEQVINKILRYQSAAFASEDWLSGVSFIATDDRYQIAEGSHNYVIDNYSRARGYRGVFPSNPERGGDKLYAITHRVSDAKVHEVMNLGRTIIDYSGHGSSTSWAGPNVSQSDVRALRNDSLPFVIGNACNTGDFRVGESFAETWLRHPYGAIAYWGSMDSSYWDEDDILEKRMFDAIFRDGMHSIGDFTSYALSEVWRHYGGAGYSKYYWETYTIIGDASVQLRTTRSEELKIEGAMVLPVGASEVSYLVRGADGQPKANAKVALTMPGRDFAVAKTTAEDGKVHFAIASATRENNELKLVATAVNAKPVEKSLSIIPAEEPFINIHETAVNERSDMVVYAGEEVQLGLWVTNLGLTATTGGNIHITNITGPAKLSQGQATLPALATRALARVQGGLGISVDADATNQASIRVALRWTTNEGQSGDTEVNLKVARATIRVTGVELAAGQGLRPGETGDVILTIQNDGAETLSSAQLRGVAGECATLFEGDVSIVELAPMASLRLPAMRLSIGENCRSGGSATFGLSGTYHGHARDLPLDAKAKLTIGVLQSKNASFSQINRPIPDNAPALVQDLVVTEDGVIVAFGVRVKIAHPYISDLSVKLQHPDGTSINLHEQTGGSADDLDRTYGLGGEPLASLDVLQGKTTHGIWKLIIEDHAPQDQGSLQLAELKFNGYFD